jgi:hypothetical protein
VKVAFRLSPDGSPSLAVAGAAVPVGATGEAVFETAAEALRDREGVWAATAARVDLTLSFAVKRGSDPAAEGTVALSVPLTPLRVDFPADGAPTTEESVSVRGETVQGGTLTVGGAPLQVNENGTFSVEIPLAGGEPQAIEVRAARPGALARSATVRVRRVTVETLRSEAEAFAAGRAPAIGYADFAVDTAAFQGRPVDLLGRINSVPVSREGVVSFVLFVDTASGCPARQVCAVMVHARTAVPLLERDRVRVLGEVRGREQTSSETFPDLPALDAAFVVPR